MAWEEWPGGVGLAGRDAEVQRPAPARELNRGIVCRVYRVRCKGQSGGAGDGQGVSRTDLHIEAGLLGRVAVSVNPVTESAGAAGTVTVKGSVFEVIGGAMSAGGRRVTLTSTVPGTVRSAESIHTVNCVGEGNEKDKSEPSQNSRGISRFEWNRFRSE